MRLRFKNPILRSHFKTAWSCLPPEVRENLSTFIRQVREVDRISTTIDIRWPNGNKDRLDNSSIFGSNGCTCYARNGGYVICDILLPGYLSLCSAPATISIMLRQLASANDIFTDPLEVRDRERAETERRAEETAMTWALESSLDETLIQMIANAIDHESFEESMLALRHSPVL